MTGVLTRKEEPQGRHHVTIGAEAGVVQPQPRDAMMVRNARAWEGGVHGTDSPSESPGRNQPLISDCRPPEP